MTVNMFSSILSEIVIPLDEYFSTLSSFISLESCLGILKSMVKKYNDELLDEIMSHVEIFREEHTDMQGSYLRQVQFLPYIKSMDRGYTPAMQRYKNMQFQISIIVLYKGNNQYAFIMWKVITNFLEKHKLQVLNLEHDQKMMKNFRKLYEREDDPPAVLVNGVIAVYEKVDTINLMKILKRTQRTITPYFLSKLFNLKFEDFHTLIKNMKEYTLYLKYRHINTQSFIFKQQEIRFMANKSEYEYIIKKTRDYITEFQIDWKSIEFIDRTQRQIFERIKVSKMKDIWFSQIEGQLCFTPIRKDLQAAQQEIEEHLSSIRTNKVLVPARKVPELPHYMRSVTGIPQSKIASFKCRSYKINQGLFEIKTRAIGSIHTNTKSSIIIVSNFNENKLVEQLLTENNHQRQLIKFSALGKVGNRYAKCNTQCTRFFNTVYMWNVDMEDKNEDRVYNDFSELLVKKSKDKSSNTLRIVLSEINVVEYAVTIILKVLVQCIKDKKDFISVNILEFVYDQSIEELLFRVMKTELDKKVEEKVIKIQYSCYLPPARFNIDRIFQLNKIEMSYKYKDKENKISPIGAFYIYFSATQLKQKRMLVSLAQENKFCYEYIWVKYYRQMSIFNTQENNFVKYMKLEEYSDDVLDLLNFVKQNYPEIDFLVFNCNQQGNTTKNIYELVVDGHNGQLPRLMIGQRIYSKKRANYRSTIEMQIKINKNKLQFIETHKCMERIARSIVEENLNK